MRLLSLPERTVAQLKKPPNDQMQLTAPAQAMARRS
jgi:hypothetical protein